MIKGNKNDILYKFPQQINHGWSQTEENVQNDISTIYHQLIQNE